MINTYNAASRYFIDFDGSSSYAQIANPITFAGAYELSIDYAATTTATAMDFFQGGYGVNSSGVIIAPVDVTDVEIEGVSVGLGANLPIDGLFRNIKFIGSGSGAIGFIGQSGSSTNYFNGTLANPIFDDNGTILSWGLDEGADDTEYPNENVTGSEEVVNGTFDTSIDNWARVLGAASWDTGSIKVERSGGQQGRASSAVMNTVIGQLYKLTYSVGAITASSRTVRIAISATSSTGVIFEDQSLSTGTESFTFIATQTTHWVQLECGGGVDGDYATFDNFSVKAITNSLTYNNLSSRWEAELIDGGKTWLSPTELILNSTFDTDVSNWTSVLGVNTWASGEAKVARDAVNAGRFSSNTLTTVIGDTYRFSYSVSEITAGSRTGRIAISATSSTGAIYNNNGLDLDSNREMFTATQTNHWAHLECGGGASGDYALFDNVSVRRAMRLFTNPVHILGDSFATYTFEYKLENALLEIKSNISRDGVGSTSLTQQEVRFAATPEYWDSTLVIMDGGLEDTSAAAIIAIDAMVANLTHSRWVYVQHARRESDDEATYLAFVDDIIAHVGASHYVECFTDLAAANDGSANDLADIAESLVPRSLRVDTHHETTAGTAIRTRTVANHIKAQGW